MDIFDFAMQMEADGERYYRDLAEQSSNPGLRNILVMLADEEAGHRRVLQKSKGKPAELTESGLLSDARNVFAEMKSGGDSIDLGEGQAALYQKALEIEKKSCDFYRAKADETQQGYQKQLFLILAAEEDKHVFLIEHILDFISRPTVWLENAEFTHLDEY